jgi:hypothetical protein
MVVSVTDQAVVLVVLEVAVRVLAQEIHLQLHHRKVTMVVLVTIARPIMEWAAVAAQVRRLRQERRLYLEMAATEAHHRSLELL